MPTYKCRIRMRDSELLGDNDYSFNFHITYTGTSDNAWGQALNVAECYQGTLNPATVTIYEVSIFNPFVINGVQNRPVDLAGARTVTGSPIPGWNCARLNARSAAGSRIHVFYPRAGLTENDIIGQGWHPDFQTAQDSFISAISLVTTMSDKDGGLFTSYSFSPLVQMRQLGWRRRTRAGYHRGWVPDA